jgi:GNAT superfamily N-acetyltransferase
VTAPARVARLEWDSRHFGVEVGRLEGGADGLAEALADAARGGLRLVIARVEAAEPGGVARLEAHGFGLADTLVRYERAPAPPPPVRARTVRVRPATPEDAAAVEALAAEAFEGYPGHFRHDPRLDPRRADEVYVRWAVNACREAGEEAWLGLAEAGPRPVGFGLVTRAAADTAEGALYAVARAARGRGIGGALLAATMDWAAARGFARMTVYSSLANPPAHRVWLAAGFAPAGGLHTLHAWLDRR